MIDTASNWPLPNRIALELPVAYFEVDANGIIRFVNDATCRLHNLSAEELVNRAIWEFLPRGEAARSRTEFFDTMGSPNDPPVIHHSLLTADGEYVIQELHRRILRDLDGQSIGMRYVSIDVSQLEGELQDARQSRVWLESVVHAVSQAVIVMDSLGFVRLLNPAAERLIGWSSKDLVDRQFEKEVPILSAVSRSNQPLNFRVALEETWNGDVTLLHRDGQPLAVWLSASPIIDEQTGFTNGVVMVLPSPESRPVRASALPPQSLPTSVVLNRDSVPASAAIAPVLP